MNEIRVCKAWGSLSARDVPTEDMIVRITESQPHQKDLNAADRFFDSQAVEIEEALHHSLPGGTYDRLVGRMLARKATHFRLSHE